MRRLRCAFLIALCAASDVGRPPLLDAASGDGDEGDGEERRSADDDTAAAARAAVDDADIDAAPPNIVLAVIDDLGTNDIGWNNPAFRTPNLDALAAAGVRLDGLYVDRQCTPSRAALMTGLYNVRTGMQDNVIYALEPRGLPLRHQLLPRRLARRGYLTIGVGKVRSRRRRARRSARARGVRGGIMFHHSLRVVSRHLNWRFGMHDASGTSATTAPRSRRGRAASSTSLATCSQAATRRVQPRAALRAVRKDCFLPSPRRVTLRQPGGRPRAALRAVRRARERRDERRRRRRERRHGAHFRGSLPRRGEMTENVVMARHVRSGASRHGEAKPPRVGGERPSSRRDGKRGATTVRVGTAPRHDETEPPRALVEASSWDRVERTHGVTRFASSGVRRFASPP